MSPEPFPEAAVASRPEDSDILEHEREVRAEAESAPLVGPAVSLDSLREQYAGNPGFLRKLEGLSQRFRALRRVRPDGNCFYRAYLFGIFEQIASHKERHKVFLTYARESLNFCLEAGYEKVAVEDFYEEFCGCLDRLGSEGAGPATAEELLPESDGYLVCWARCLTSAYLKRHAEEYISFLASHGSIQEFCAQEVDPMNTEADHLQVAALSSFFRVPVSVTYLDRSEGDTAAEHLFQDDGDSTARRPSPFLPVHLLYRPGHYDLIYPR